MKLLRNPEVTRTLIIYTIVSVAAVAGAYMLNPLYGLEAFIVCIIFILIYLISTYNRYARISKLASDINRILHGDDSISIEEYCEGDLGILKSEIYKMTVRLREQQQILLEDKRYLADSIADISHQIRTPLTSINLLVSLMSEPDISEERKNKLSGELYELLSRIEWLINALLKISKLDAGTIDFNEENTSLDRLIDITCQPLLVPVELRGQKLVINTDGNFKGDVSWTCEALGNIVKNCMEHTPDGGTIEINAAENALYTEIVIQDNGCGIDKEDLPHIFKRFYKGKNSDEKGFGVGLNLARMIIVKQNGTVKAENVMPCGAKFTVRFYKGTV